MILIIDNYDSFTYNLVQLFGSLGAEPTAVRNDAVSVEECVAMSPAAVILSPGPGRPEDAGITLPLIREIVGKVPLLGVCLGHQCLAAAFGGRIVRATTPLHGRATAVIHSGKNLFHGVPSPFQAARYHSLMVDRATVPSRFEVTARSADGTIMGLADHPAMAYGIQFHPESFMTPLGHRLISNFLTKARSCLT